jgi:hypothetical protein
MIDDMAGSAVISQGTVQAPSGDVLDYTTIYGVSMEMLSTEPLSSSPQAITATGSTTNGGDEALPVTLVGLFPGATYYYQAKAVDTTTGQVLYGEVRTFTVAGPVVTGHVVNEGEDSALLTGTVAAAADEPVSAQFQYASSPALLKTTPTLVGTTPQALVLHVPYMGEPSHPPGPMQMYSGRLCAEEPFA